ncbi:MAG: L,D-transpeptidase family protein [Rhodobacteraceae bacterium]|jgi:murein L,D-transpeptidase YafK|nr:L,D-transpeptidase family protein [Paracoccaceae bacterium]
MRGLARLFSAFTLLTLLLSAGALFYFRSTPPLPDLPPIIGTADRIIVDKSARQMALMQNGRTLRTYQIALGFAPTGDKTRQGDGRTPEGLFRIAVRNDASKYHLSLGLDYPQPQDRARAAAGGYDPGGDIMIHGQPNALPDGTVIKGDWTAGCIAVSNAEMREIWASTDGDTIVEVRP